MEFLRQTLDPFNIAGLAPDPVKDEYYKLVEEYKVQYYTAQRKGIPLDLLGYPPPKAIVKTAMVPGKFPSVGKISIGGGTKGILPTEVPILTSSGSLPESVLNEIRTRTLALREVNASAGSYTANISGTASRRPDNVESKIYTDDYFNRPESGDYYIMPESKLDPRVHTADYFDTMREVEGEDQPTSFGGRLAYQEEKYTPEYFEEKDNPTESFSKEKYSRENKQRERIFTDTNRKSKRFKEKVREAEANGQTVVTSSALRSVITKLGNNSNSILKGTGEISSSDQKLLFGTLLKNEDLQNQLLRILNKYGVSLIDKTQSDGAKIVEDMMKNSGETLAKMYNEIIQELYDGSYNPDNKAKIRKYFPQVKIESLEVPEHPQDEAKYIPHIPGIHQSIANIISANGVDAGVAGRFTSRLLSRFANISALNIAETGSITSGRTQAAEVMGQLVEDLQGALQRLYGKLNVNIPNVLQQVLFTMFEKREALKEIGGTSLAGKINVFKDLLKQVTTQAGKVKLKGWDNREIDEKQVDDSINELLGMSSDATPGEIASFLRNTTNQRDIIQRGGFRIHDNPDPETPNDPRGTDTVALELPNGIRRRVNRKNFIKALIILGVPGAIITAIMSAIKINKSINNFIIPADPGKNTNPRDYGIDNRVRDTSIKAENTKVNQPLKRNVDVFGENFKDFADIDALGKPGSKLKPLEINDTLSRLGLTDRVELYNSYVNQFNQASNAGDNFDKAHWQSKLMNLKRIMEGVVNQARPDSSVSLDKTITVDLPDIRTRYDNTGTYNGHKKIKPLVLTDDMIKKGTAPIVNLYNAYIQTYNDAVDNQFEAGIVAAEKNLNKIVAQSKIPVRTGVSAYTDAQLAGSYTENEATIAELNSVRDQLIEAIKAQSGQPATTASNAKIAMLHRKYTELNSKVKFQTKFGEVTGDPKSYLKDVVSEQFPQTDEDTTLFKKLQTMEKQLTGYVNPIDKTNQALTEYNDFTSNLEVGLDPTSFYKARMAKLSELYSKYKIPNVPEEAPEDDPFSNITDTVETVEPPESKLLENDARPDMFTGGEATILLSTAEEQLKEDIAWQEYSVVEPGFGNGPTNPLYLQNLESDKLRFGPLQKPLPYEQPTIYPPIAEEDQPKPHNIYRDPGQFYDEFDNTVFSPTPEYITDVSRRNFENENSGYFPERNLARYRSRPVRIPQIRDDGQRFAPYSYKYGERIDRVNWGVQNENVPYPNAKGFPQIRQIPGWQYELVRKR